MVGKERRRVHVDTQTISSGATFNLVGTVDETTMVNAHGMTLSFLIEPLVQDANASGIWALSCLPRTGTAFPSLSQADVEGEEDNPVFWALGVFSASNQTPFNKEVRIKTSRNCPAGTRIVLSVRLQDLTTGTARIQALMTYFNRSM